MGILVSIVLCKNIPKIGGNVRYALLAAGAAALICGGVFNPIEWGKAWFNGIDRMAWVLSIVAFGGIYAETQVRIGTMETVLESLRAKLGHNPKGLIFVIMFVLMIAGSLLGESIASATLIGVLVMKNMEELEMSPEEICATLVMGCTLGSMCPPVTFGFTNASSIMGLTNIQGDQVLNNGYLALIPTFILCVIYVCFRFVRVKQIPENLIPKKTAGEILREGWTTLIPTIVLATIIILRSGFGIDVLKLLDPVFAPIANIKIISGFNYSISKAIYIALLTTFFFKSVRNDIVGVFAKGFKNSYPCFAVMFSASFLLGAFYMGGQIDRVVAFCTSLHPTVLIVAGGLTMVLFGMMSGSMTATQMTIFSFYGPALVAIGVTPVNAATAGALLAAAGQGMPPADTVTFVVAGLVSSVLGKDINLIKSMFYSSFMCFCYIIAAYIFLFLVK